MFAGDPRGDFDTLGGGLEGRETFHESATDDGGPAVGGLHDFDGWVRGGGGERGADGFAEVRGLAEPADEEDCFDGEVFLFCGGDLALD